MFPSPKELDAQSLVQLDGWVDMDSERWRALNNEHESTRKWIHILMKEPAYLFTDSLGRIFGRGENGYYYPYYIQYGNKKYGIRIAKKAAN